MSKRDGRRALLVAGVLALAALVGACQGIYFDGENALNSDGGTNGPNPNLVGFTPKQVSDALASTKNFILIDVHTPYAGKLPGTDASIPYTNMDAIAAFVGADFNTNVVLTCKTGPMSITAGNALLDRGYKNVGYLIGGTDAWVAAGYSLVQ